MNGIPDNLQTLTQTVLSEARSDAEQILADARQKAEGIRNDAREQAERERKEVLDQVTRETERLRSQSLSTAQLDARTAELKGREELLNRVFEKANRQLPAMQQWKEYPQVAHSLARDALLHLRSSSARLRADPNTQKHLGQTEIQNLEKELNMHIDLGAPLEQGLGVVAETPDGRRQYDNTLEARLRRVQENLRAPVYHILMGESQ
jgi:V/A-type H+/Na+-transporting ATPase subunit E